MGICSSAGRRFPVPISGIKMVRSRITTGNAASFLLTIFIVLATQAIANVVKTSFGPSGLDKMMVDDIGVGSASFRSSPSVSPSARHCCQPEHRLTCYRMSQLRTMEPPSSVY